MAEDAGPVKPRRSRAYRTTLMGQRLWQQAQHDIQVAVLLLRPESYYGAANFAHQAAEKSLKAAYWHLRREEPPWKHHLAQLVEQLAELVGVLPPEVNTALTQLAPMFERSRYPTDNVNDPIPAELIGEQDARVSIESAEEVMTWVQTLLQLPTSRIRRRKDS